MTNEDAIRILNLMSRDMTVALVDLPKKNPMYDVLTQRIEAIDRAQNALRQWNDYLKNLV